MSKKMLLEGYAPDSDLLAARLVDRAPLVVQQRARRLGAGSCPCSACRGKRS